MNEDLGEVGAKVTLNDKQYVEVINGLENKTKAAFDRIAKMAAGLFGLNVLKGFVKDSVQAFIKQENAVNMLDRSLRRLGEGKASKRLQEFAKEMQKVTTYGDGIDSGDKSVGKAMTYADKYALLKAYKIVTGDDPDQEASKDLNSYKKDEKSSGGATQTKMQTKVSREDIEKELETAVWQKGKHQGERIIDTDEDYLSWYIESGYNPHIKELCKVALEMIREADLDPEDDPDMQPIDGEEGLPF